MSRPRWAIPVAVILAGPAALGFFSGGFFDEPRLVAAIAAWALVLAAAVLSPQPLPRSWPGRLALGSMGGLFLWTLASLTWAPLGGVALDDVQRLLLYAGALTAAAAWLRPPEAARLAEPALAFGAVVVVGYGLSERLLPGLIDLDASASAGGRLEQPLTYWNAVGAIAALGMVLCVRMAGSPDRPPVLRAACAAAAAPLAAGIYLTLSRGAVFALLAGVLVLLALAPGRPQLKAAGLAVVAGVLAAAVATLLPELRSTEALDTATTEGAVLLAGLLGLSVAAAAAQLRWARSERGVSDVGELRSRGAVRAAAAVLAALVVAAGVVTVVSVGDGKRPTVGAEAGRLRSIESSRYDYWAVALRSFADAPLRGVGTAGFRVEWLRERDLPETVRDAHSLYIEVAAELGLVGLALLLGLIGGVAVAARRAYRLAPAATAGPGAALVAFAAHAGLDWDWEMPAVSLMALVLAGLLIAVAERGPRTPAPPPPAPSA